MKIKSNLNEFTYDASVVRYVYNTKQAYLFIKNGAVLLDCFAGCNTLVFVFGKKETKHLMDRWMAKNLS